MFTGIIETLGKIVEIEESGTNKTFKIQSDISKELKIDQSVAHSGVCLTVIDLDKSQGWHKVTAIQESLDLSNLGMLSTGSLVNLERCARLSDRLDGHIVQGHVDNTGICKSIEEFDGSWVYTFSYDPEYAALIVPKGSICVNGVSLTVIDPLVDQFKVAIIPFTYEHTNFQDIKAGDKVNLEFDIIGKYILRKEQLKKVLL